MSSTRRITKSVAGSIVFLLVLVLGGAQGRAEQVKNLKPQGYVNDFAGVLSAPAREKLTALCAEVEQKTKAQIAVVTVSSLEGETAQQFSLDLAVQWGVGPKQDSRGILILIAPNDHQYFTQVGYGLEPILPDGKVGGFGREAVPLLRQNDYDGAILLLTQRVAAVIAADQNVTLDTLNGAAAPSAPSEPDNTPFSVSSIIWLLLLIIFFGFPVLGFILRLLFGGAMNTRSRGGMWTGGPWYGGGSWGGGGGGGFGGFGGGSFGGGGAGGSW